MPYIYKEIILKEQELLSLQKYSFLGFVGDFALYLMGHAEDKNLDDISHFPVNMCLTGQRMSGQDVLQQVLARGYKQIVPLIKSQHNNHDDIEDKEEISIVVYRDFKCNGMIGRLFYADVLGVTNTFVNGKTLTKKDLESQIIDKYPSLKIYKENPTALLNPYIYVQAASSGFKRLNFWGKYKHLNIRKFNKFPYDAPNQTKIQLSSSVDEIDEQLFDELVNFQYERN